MEWILVIALMGNSGSYAGGGKALTTISGYKTKASCEDAGRATTRLEGIRTVSTYACIGRPK